MRRFTLALVLSLAATLATGCVVAPVSLAPSTTPVERGKYTVVGESTGRAWGLIIFGYPITEPSMAGAARDRAIEAAGADALVNVAVDNTVINLYWFSIIFTTVTGDGVMIDEDQA